MIIIMIITVQLYANFVYVCRFKYVFPLIRVVSVLHRRQTKLNQQKINIFESRNMSLLLSSFRHGTRNLPRCASVIYRTPNVKVGHRAALHASDGHQSNGIPRRYLSSMNPNDFIAVSLIDSVTFETVCSDTLESLCDYFELLVEDASFLKSADITYGVCSAIVYDITR